MNQILLACACELGCHYSLQNSKVFKHNHLAFFLGIHFFCAHKAQAKKSYCFFGTYMLLLQCLSIGKIEISISLLDIEIWNLKNLKVQKFEFFWWRLYDDLGYFLKIFLKFAKKSRRMHFRPEFHASGLKCSNAFLLM